MLTVLPVACWWTTPVVDVEALVGRLPEKNAALPEAERPPALELVC